MLDTIDPIRDISIIENELRLKDIQTLASLKKLKKGNVCTLRICCKPVSHFQNFKFDLKAYAALVDKVQAGIVGVTPLLTSPELESGAQARNLQITPTHPDYEMFSSFRLLSSKPVLYVCNVEETSAATGNEYSNTLKEYLAKNRPESRNVLLSAVLEFEVHLVFDFDTHHDL